MNAYKTLDPADGVAPLLDPALPTAVRDEGFDADAALAAFRDELQRKAPNFLGPLVSDRAGLEADLHRMAARAGFAHRLGSVTVDASCRVEDGAAVEVTVGARFVDHDAHVVVTHGRPEGADLPGPLREALEALALPALYVPSMLEPVELDLDAPFGHVAVSRHRDAVLIEAAPSAEGPLALALGLDGKSATAKFNVLAETEEAVSLQVGRDGLLHLLA